MIQRPPHRRGRGLASLRRLVAANAAAQTRCELCAAAIDDDHQHLIDPHDRRLLCVCMACALLFSGAAETQYRRVPPDVLLLNNFTLTDVFWHSLAIPIGLVFFFRSSAAQQVMAIYPSPAGPTETVLDVELWEDLSAQNPALRDLPPDVAALLINRLHGSREYYIVPIDECYRLVGLIRQTWRGFSGGDEAWRAIETFFNSLKRRSQPAPALAHA